MKALKITEEIIRENAFEHKKKKPRLRANRPSNNWALDFINSLDECMGRLQRRLVNRKRVLLPFYMP